MIKTYEVVQHLQELICKAHRTEQAHRNALAAMTGTEEQTLFIYFWQDHARMMCELENKVRWLGGTPKDNGSTAWGRLIFKEEPEEEQKIVALCECEHRDAEMLEAYAGALRHALPVDVQALLKLHSLKIKGIHARILQRLVVMRGEKSWNVAPKSLPFAAAEPETLFS